MLETTTKPARRRPLARRLDGGAVLVAGILLLALNLRPAAVALAPILEDLRDGLGLSTAEVVLLPALPILCFGAFAPLGPPLRRWLGEERALGLVLALVLVGLTARGLVPHVALLAGTVLAGAAIGAGNVLVPSLVKRRLPHRAGIMTGLYTTTLAVGGGIATGLTVPALEATGGSLRAALLAWAVPVVVGLVAWAPQLRFGPPARPPPPVSHTGTPVPDARPPASGARLGLWGDRLAWQVTLLFGLQSLMFYTVIGWLPTLLRSEGYSPSHAGAVTTIVAVLGPVGSMVAPILAARARDQRGALLTSVGLCALGVAGLLVTPTGAGAIAAAVTLGIGMGAIFAMAVLLFLMRSADSDTAALLSSMAQTFGYILAAAGPFAFGLLHEATGGWTVPLLMLLGLIAVEAPLALGAGRDRQIRA